MADTSHPNSLQSFISAFNGGNRAHRYEVTMGWPEAVNTLGTDSQTLDRFFVRAVSLPPSQLNPIRIPYRGRILKWPGDRVYFPWTIRILDQNAGSPNGNLANKSIWNSFNAWSNVMNNHVTNISSDNFKDFTTDWVVKQVDEHGDTIKEVTLMDCWPTVVGPISMDSNAIDTLVEFTVTVEYQWQEITGLP